MFVSTDVRHKALNDFKTNYKHKCDLRGTMPVKYILDGISSNSLSVDISKVRAGDWPPFLQSLPQGRKLESIELYSSWDGKKPTPTIHHEKNSITRELMRNISQIFSRKNALKILSFSNFKIDVPSAHELSKGLNSCYTGIYELQFIGCKLGDVGFSKINKSIKVMSSLINIDLSHCELSNGSVSLLTDTLRQKSSETATSEWVSKLRDETENRKIHGLTSVILNKNPKISNSIVELIEAINKEEILCLSRLELRQCGISATDQIDQHLSILLQDPPPCLQIFDVRLNPILDDMKTKTLVQLIMAKLLSSYPTAEYTDLSLYSSQKDHNSPANTFIDTHEVDPLAATKIIRRGESSNGHRRVKNKGRGYELHLDSGSDSEYNIELEYQDLPPLSVNRDDLEDDEEISQLKERIRQLEVDYDVEHSKRKEAEQKYSDLSKRISEIENVIDQKDNKIRNFEKEKEGFVLVEEDLLRNVESSFANFQNFLNKLTDMGLGELADIANGHTELSETDLVEIRSRLISGESYLPSSNY